jgi:membrane-associated phospholipid phosphatase
MPRDFIHDKITNLLGITMPKGNTPIPPQPMNPMWWVCGILGLIFWVSALVIWYQKGLDESVIFYYNQFRIDYTPIVAVSRWLSSFGMAFITAIYISYLVLSQRFKRLDAPLTVYLFVIFSFAISGIAGDVLKEVIGRSRPAVDFAGEILVLGGGDSPAIPSGHTTKSMALILPFLFMVSNRLNLHKFIKALFIVFALGISYSRIVLGAHYVSDVLAGIGMAFICFPVAMLSSDGILKKNSQEKLPVLSKIWGVILIFLTLIFLSI